VLNVSTIPNVGFKARLAMPVLKDLLVISRIAVPVVSEPVPAVVGTENGSELRSHNPKATTCDKGSESLSDRKTFAHGSVDKIHKICILVYGESIGRN
jgi:hypothetical protein